MNLYKEIINFIFATYGLLMIPNVCTQRQEDIEDIKASNDNGEEKKSNSQTFHFGVHLTLNSCVERSHKHVCKSVVNENGKTKTVSITRQCCHGYGRRNDGDVTKTCEKLNLVSVMETSEKLGAKEFVKSAKHNQLEDMLTKKNVTLFLPTDASFTEFSEQMFESNLVVLPQVARRRRSTEGDYLSGFTSKDLALNHIVDDWIDIHDIENEQILQTQYENLTIRMNIYPRPPNDNSYEYMYRYTANCAPLVKVNEMAENGIVHMIDRVLTPVTKNLMELVRSRSDMAVLRTVLEKTNLADLLEKETKHFTLFAPNDKAFGKLNEHLRKTIKNGNECAMNIIKNHILEMSFCSVAVVDGVRTSAENSLGLKLNLERADASNDETSENEIADLTGIKSILINGKAKILETDIIGTNGILHVIDTVLPTESGLPISSMLQSQNLTVFGELIEYGGFADEFDDMMNVSFFVPKDDAFEGNKWVNMLKENPNELKGNAELKSFLMYHIAKPLTKTCDLTEEVIKTENGNGLRVNLYSTHSVLNNVMNRATINCARLVHFDDISCGSVVHQVDRVLTPPTTNLLGALEANENYSMFLRLIQKSNLTHMLDDVNQNLTMLVPTNDIFRELKEFYDELLENRNQLERFIRLHILDDVLCCAGIVQTQWPFVRVVKTINDYELRISRDRRPKIANAGITKCDIIAKNGIILEINDVIN
ncbi:Transforming growth factor-beta-induced protein ig-h3, partial [Pseudolycoriella hygida]